MRADGPAESVVIKVRRYRCRACRAVIVVGPRGLVRGRWYSGGAIGLAIAAYGGGESSASVRGRVSPSAAVGPSARERWVTLARWIDAAQEGRLFGCSRLNAHARRDVAERVGLVLAGRAGRALGEDLLDATFAGAAIAA
jgi:hypothetical protein